MHVVFFFLALVFLFLVVVFFAIDAFYILLTGDDPDWLLACLLGSAGLAAACCAIGVLLMLVFSALAYITENGVLL